MHSVLAVDKNGNPLGNAITWADNRANKEAQELKNSSLGKRIYTCYRYTLASDVAINENCLDKKQR